MEKVIRFGAVVNTGSTVVAGAEILTEIESAGHVLHTHDLRHMAGVLGQCLHCLFLRLGMDEAVVHVDPHDASGIPDRAQLLIRQVAPHVAEGAAVGVGGDHRPVGQPQNIPETAVVQVGHIHCHPQRLHAADGLFPQFRQSLLRVALGTGGQRILLVPGQHPHAGAEFRVAVDIGKVLPHGGHTLHADEGIQLSGGFRRLRPGGGADDLQPGALCQLCPGTGEDLLRPAAVADAVLRVGPDGQHHALHAAPAQPLQMAALQNPGLPCQSAAGHVKQQIGMSVQHHVLPAFPALSVSSQFMHSTGKRFAC